MRLVALIGAGVAIVASLLLLFSWALPPPLDATLSGIRAVGATVAPLCAIIDLLRTRKEATA